MTVSQRSAAEKLRASNVAACQRGNVLRAYLIITAPAARQQAALLSFGFPDCQSIEDGTPRSASDSWTASRCGSACAVPLGPLLMSPNMSGMSDDDGGSAVLAWIAVGIAVLCLVVAVIESLLL